MLLFKNTTIWYIPAFQLSNKWEYKLERNVIWGEFHKILSRSWSTEIQRSITINQNTPPPTRG